MFWDEIKRALAATGDEGGSVLVEYNKQVLEHIQQDINQRAKLIEEECVVEKGDTRDFLTNLKVAITDCLHHEWEDQGIGSYEFWGMGGVDTNWQPVLQNDSVWVEFPANVLFVPIWVKGIYTSKDGTHNCEVVTIPFTAKLCKVIPGEHEKFLAEYGIEQNR